jgi:predicted RNA-binding Zn-ribbon protein involved in translation (DUF1610 family)
MIERQCDKATFTSKNIADHEILRIRKSPRNRKHQTPVRSYKCPDCGWWHLTKMHHYDAR